MLICIVIPLWERTVNETHGPIKKIVSGIKRCTMEDSSYRHHKADNRVA